MATIQTIVKPEVGIVLPDMHVPRHDKAAVRAVRRYIRDRQPDKVIQLGDLLDMNVVSSHNDGNLRAVEGQRIADEYEAGNLVLDELQSDAPNADWYLLEGNHEYRLERYLNAHPAAAGMVEVPIGLRLTERGITWIPNWSEGQVLTWGKANFIHGLYTNEHHAKKHVEIFGESVFYGHCFSEDTELLTRRGWLKRQALTSSDEVMTLNTETGFLEFNSITAFHDYTRPPDPMVRILGQNVDLLVTSGHGLVELRCGRIEKFVAADFAKTSTRTLICAGDMKLTKSSYTDDELRLIVWISADGSLENSRNTVRFNFRKQRKITRLRELLGRLDIPFTETISKTGSTKFYINIGDRPHITRLFKWTAKHFPEELAWCGQHAARVILEEYTHTDGCHTGPNSIQIATSKESEADLLQQIFVTNGLRCNKTQHGNDSWTLAVNTAHTISELRPINFYPEFYERSVWCVTVPNGTLLVRRNGKVCITQNTHDIQRFSKVTKATRKTRVGQSLGCLCEAKAQPYMRGRPTKWEEAVATFFMFPDGMFRYEVHNIFDGLLVVGGEVYDGNKN